MRHFKFSTIKKNLASQKIINSIYLKNIYHKFPPMSRFFIKNEYVDSWSSFNIKNSCCKMGIFQDLLPVR